jgi:hypothetical protein
VSQATALTRDIELPPLVTWFDVRRLLQAEWVRSDYGQHVAVLAPTETGKTYLVTRGLLPLMPYSLTIDGKTGVPGRGKEWLPDDPDNRMHARWMGAHVCDRYPQPDIARFWGKDPYPHKHYWVAPRRSELRDVVSEALSESLVSKKKHGIEWTVYVDEIKKIAATGDEGEGLGAPIIEWLRYGRTKGTFIGSTQSPRYNGPSMGDFVDQPRWKFIGFTADGSVVERYAEISGFPRKTAMAVVPNLREHEWWLLGPHRLSVRFNMPGPKALRRPRRQSSD